jgi:putative transposase
VKFAGAAVQLGFVDQDAQEDVECLDWTLVLGRRHLLRLLRVYVRHYNEQRPHRGLALAVPQARERRSLRVNPRAVRRRNVLGGLIHEYHEVAA